MMWLNVKNEYRCDDCNQGNTHLSLVHMSMMSVETAAPVPQITRDDDPILA